MPLKGNVQTLRAETALAADVVETNIAPKIPTKAKDTSVSKEEYWARKEERDIRNGQCIRLSGVLQALLGSVNYGQYCTTTDKESYLSQVKADAKALAKFITEEA